MDLYKRTLEELAKLIKGEANEEEVASNLNVPKEFVRQLMEVRNKIVTRKPTHYKKLIKKYGIKKGAEIYQKQKEQLSKTIPFEEEKKEDIPKDTPKTAEDWFKKNAPELLQKYYTSKKETQMKLTKPKEEKAKTIIYDKNIILQVLPPPSEDYKKKIQSMIEDEEAEKLAKSLELVTKAELVYKFLFKDDKPPGIPIFTEHELKDLPKIDWSDPYYKFQAENDSPFIIDPETGEQHWATFAPASVWDIATARHIDARGKSKRQVIDLILLDQELAAGKKDTEIMKKLGYRTQRSYNSALRKLHEAKLQFGEEL